MEFEFLAPGYLSDGEIYLRLIKTEPENELTGVVPSYSFAITGRENDAVLGIISLRAGFNERIRYGGHIGYYVQEQHRGRRYALKACNLILDFARRHGMEKLIITCNPDNMPSRRTCELLGARFIEIVDLPEHNDMYKFGERQKCVYELEL